MQNDHLWVPSVATIVAGVGHAALFATAIFFLVKKNDVRFPVTVSHMKWSRRDDDGPCRNDCTIETDVAVYPSPTVSLLWLAILVEFFGATLRVVDYLHMHKVRGFTKNVYRRYVAYSLETFAATIAAFGLGYAIGRADFVVNANRAALVHFIIAAHAQKDEEMENGECVKFTFCFKYARFAFFLLTAGDLWIYFLTFDDDSKAPIAARAAVGTLFVGFFLALYVALFEQTLRVYGCAPSSSKMQDHGRVFLWRRGALYIASTAYSICAVALALFVEN